MSDHGGMRAGRDERGLTLVELMVVALIISIGILTLSLVQTHSFRDVYRTGMHTRALEVAGLQLEAARSVGFTLAQSDSGVTGGFTWNRQVDSLDVGLRRVTSTASWMDNGVIRSVRLMDLISAR